jgi:hypothetical protein
MIRAAMRCPGPRNLAPAKMARGAPSTRHKARVRLQCFELAALLAIIASSAAREFRESSGTQLGSGARPRGRWPLLEGRLALCSARLAPRLAEGRPLHVTQRSEL